VQVDRRSIKPDTPAEHGEDKDGANDAPAKELARIHKCRHGGAP
jgi:hypothetical protein